VKEVTKRADHFVYLFEPRSSSYGYGLVGSVDGNRVDVSREIDYKTTVGTAGPGRKEEVRSKK